MFAQVISEVFDAALLKLGIQLLLSTRSHAENLVRVDLLSFLPEVLGTFEDLLADEV